MSVKLVQSWGMISLGQHKDWKQKETASLILLVLELFQVCPITSVQHLTVTAPILCYTNLNLGLSLLHRDLISYVKNKKTYLI